MEVKAVGLPNMKPFPWLCFLSETEKVQLWALVKTSVCCLAYSSQSPVFIVNGLWATDTAKAQRSNRKKMVLQPPRPLRTLILPYSYLTLPIKGFWTFPLHLPVSLFPVFPSATKITVWLFFFKWLWLANKMCRIYERTCCCVEYLYLWFLFHNRNRTKKENLNTSNVGWCPTF